MADAKTKYYKLGPKAASFYDPKSGLSLAGKEVAQIDGSKAKGSQTLVAAIAGGHVVEVDEEEYSKAKAKKLNAPKQQDAGVDTKRTATSQTEDNVDDDEDEEDEELDPGDEEEGEDGGNKKAELDKAKA